MDGRQGRGASALSWRVFVYEQHRLAFLGERKRFGDLMRYYARGIFRRLRMESYSARQRWWVYVQDKIYAQLAAHANDEGGHARWEVSMPRKLPSHLERVIDPATGRRHTVERQDPTRRWHISPQLGWPSDDAGWASLVSRAASAGRAHQVDRRVSYEQVLLVMRQR
jgi:hypothetical protein